MKRGTRISPDYMLKYTQYGQLTSHISTSRHGRRLPIQLNSSITVYYKREALECNSEIVFRIMMRLNAWPYKFLSQYTQHSLDPIPSLFL